MIIRDHHYLIMSDFAWACKDIMLKKEEDGIAFVKEFLITLLKEASSMERQLYIHEMLDVCHEFTAKDNHNIKARMKSIYDTSN